MINFEQNGAQLDDKDILQSDETPALHVGLLSLNRKFLLSEDPAQPNLFGGELEQEASTSYERHAWQLLARRGITTSGVRLLVPELESRHQGYLLRESRRVDIDELGFTAHSKNEIETHLSKMHRHDIRSHFLGQIVRYM